MAWIIHLPAVLSSFVFSLAVHEKACYNIEIAYIMLRKGFAANFRNDWEDHYAGSCRMHV